MRDYKSIDDVKQQMIECLEKAYDKGYNDGQDNELAIHDVVFDKAYAGGYNNGAFDAWGCARWLFTMESSEREKLFNSKADAKELLFARGEQEVIKIFKTYRESLKNDIIAGDEVTDLDGNKRVVIVTDSLSDTVLLWGEHGHTLIDKKFVTKTGRHFDEINSVLKYLKSDEPKQTKKTCGDCKEFGTVNCSETYREPTKDDDACEDLD